MIISMEVNPKILAIDITSSVSFDSEQVMELIKCLDIEMADYEFTFELAKYLVSQLEAECEHSGEVFNVYQLKSKKGEK